MKKEDLTKNATEKGRGFLSGVMVLSVSTLIVKVIGLAYKIPMMSLLGAEGMGYFNSAYDIYALLCVISTAGLPVALSMMISSCADNDGYGRMARIYRTAMNVFVALGIAGSAFMIIFAGRISSLIENERAYLCIIAIAPALLFVCVSSAIRGYFQGLCRMTPTAVSQLIEALGKLFLGILFAGFAQSKGYDVAVSAAFAILGISIGTLMSAVYLLILKTIENKKNKYKKSGLSRCERRERITGTLFKIAVPITLSSAVLGITRIIDMAVIMRRLQDIGYTSVMANEAYGAYTTLAVPVFGLIPSLIAPIALALVPRLSAAIARNSRTDQSDVTGAAIRITTLFAIPASIGVSAYAGNILELLFPRESEAVEMISPLLSLLGASILFSCIITTTNAILQSYKRTSKPIISMGIGALIKIISAYLLIGNPEIGLYGAPISTLLCNGTVTVINLYYVNKYAVYEERLSRVYVKPLIASCAMMVISFATYLLLSSATDDNTLAFVFAIVSAVISYLAFVILLGVVDEDDIILLPFGERLLKIIKKIGFFRSENNKI